MLLDIEQIFKFVQIAIIFLIKNEVRYSIIEENWRVKFQCKYEYLLSYFSINDFNDFWEGGETSRFKKEYHINIFWIVPEILQMSMQLINLWQNYITKKNF